MAPEYAMHGIFSVKSDVFSFGVLVLEIISGKKNRRIFDVEPSLNLLNYVSINALSLFSSKDSDIVVLTLYSAQTIDKNSTEYDLCAA